MRDISVRKREAEKIRYMAEHDTLTGLANRNKLHEQLDTTLAEAKAEKREVALLMIDLDKFKQINDTLGHACGDQLLCGVAARLNDLVEGAGLVARLGGDEFAVVISGTHATERAKEFSKRMSLAFSQTPFARAPAPGSSRTPGIHRRSRGSRPRCNLLPRAGIGKNCPPRTGGRRSERAYRAPPANRMSNG